MPYNVNLTDTDGFNKTDDRSALNQRLESLIKCQKKSFESNIYRSDKYWVLENFIKAEHGELECYELVTYATQGDYSELYNLKHLVDR